MTPESFARQLAAELEFDFQFEGITWRLREWTEPQYLGLLGQIPDGQLANPIAALPVLVPPAIIGWTGIKWSDLRDGAPNEPLPFSPSLIPFVLNNYRGLLGPALVELDRRYNERNKLAESELGN